VEATLTGAVESVTGRQVNTKYGEKTVFAVVIDGKKLDCWKADIAEAANALSGIPVEATYRQEQKGDFTNYVLLGVKPAVVGGNTANGSAGIATTTTQTSNIPVTTAPSTIPVTTAADDVRGKVRSLIAAQLAAAVYSSLPADDRTREAALGIAEAMTDYALNGPQKTLDEAIQEDGLAAAVAPATVSPSEATDDVPW